jgi:hypothetical protein
VREHIDHASAAKQQVGFDGAPGGPDELAKIVHRRVE